MLETFKQILEAKSGKITMKKLPMIIPGGKYDDEIELSIYDKNEGEYEYAQIEEVDDNSGDYDDGEVNIGYTLNIEVEIKDNKIYANTKVTDLGRKAHTEFSKKYSGMEFDSIDAFVKQVQKIVKEFDKL
jgi:hypothetical protein